MVPTAVVKPFSGREDFPARQRFFETLLPRAPHDPAVACGRREGAAVEEVNIAPAGLPAAPPR